MTPRGSQRRSSLFRRIYTTVVFTVLAGVAVGAVATWGFLHQRSAQWVGDTIDLLEERNDALVAVLDDSEALALAANELGEALDTSVVIADAKGRPLTRVRHDGRPRRGRRGKRLAKALSHGRPMVQERGKGNTHVLFPLLDPITARVVAIVTVRPNEPPRGLPMIISVVATLALLGFSARALSRSLTSRLSNVEASAERIANGELSHRVQAPQGPPEDELDELAISFNDMADKLEALIQGQRVLLANVSHELRTPIARVRVVLEILEGRIEPLRGATENTPEAKHVERLGKGLADIGRDTQELEQLITDLLTSGRLDLSAAGGNLELEPVALDELAERMAERVGATVDAPDAPSILCDRLLLERMLSNLLSNARRACPEGMIHVEVQPTTRGFSIAVEDEGHGIDPEDRERVFQAFRRLDAARSRDQGGVGLGLYLCRQIARAHGGDVSAHGRNDGKSGARMVIELPQAPPRAESTDSQA